MAGKSTRKSGATGKRAKSSKLSVKKGLGLRTAVKSKAPIRTPAPAKGASAHKARLSRNRALEAEVQKYRHCLMIFRQAGLALSLDASLNKILEELTFTVSDFFSADAASCMLWDASKQNLITRASYGFSGELTPERCIPFEVLQRHNSPSRDYLVTPNLRNSPFSRMDVVRRENLVSALSVALRMGERLLGVLNIYSRGRKRNFSLSEIESAKLLAQQAATIVLNAQLLTELKEEVQIANTLLQVAEDIGSLGSLDEVLSRIVNIISRVLNFEVCAVFLWEKNKNFYLPAKAVGLPFEHSPFFNTLILHRRDLEFSEAERQQRSVISAQAAPGRFPVEKLANVLGHKDLYLVPLVIKGQLLGALLAGGFKGGLVLDAKGETFFRGIAAQAAIAIDDANLFSELEQAFWDTIKSLAAAIEAKDHYTHDHSEAVIQYGTAIAEELDLTAHDKELVRKACLLHDVGKIGIGDEILRKVSPLTPEERKIIERHPIIGQEILSSVRSLAEVSRIIRHHHEFYDGNGYPDHLQGEQIPLLSRILQIADSFDAMTSDRPYRKALSLEQAVEELRKNSGRQFDPELVQAFLRVLGKLERPKHAD